MRRSGRTIHSVHRGWTLVHMHSISALFGTRTQPDTCCLFARGSQCDFGDPDRLWDHSWLVFSGNAVPDLLVDSGLPLNTPMPGISPDRLIAILTMIRQELTRPNGSSEPVMHSLLQALMHDLARQHQEHHADTAADAIPRTFVAAKAFIDSHFHERITLDELAAQVHLSPRRFATCFRGYFGIAPIQLVIRLRLAQAKLLLTDVNLRLAEVAEAVGYGDYCQFSRLFKQHTGISPRQFRYQSQ